MKPNPRIQFADLLEAEVCRKAVSICRPVDGQVVQNDRLTFCGQHDVNLDRGRPCSLCCFECWQCVLRIMKAVAAVATDMNTSRVAGKEAEGHSICSSIVRARLLYKRALTVSRTTSSTGK